MNSPVYFRVYIYTNIPMYVLFNKKIKVKLFNPHLIVVGSS